MTCTITFYASGPCRECGLALNPARVGAVQQACHATDEGIFCASHCPVHRAPELTPWEGEAQDMVAEQLSLL